MKSPIPFLLLPGLIALSGCLYQAREATDHSVRELAARPYDVMPAAMRSSSRPGATGQEKSLTPGPEKRPGEDGKPTDVHQVDVQATAYMEAVQDPKQPAARFQLTVPEAIPGSEAPLLKLPPDPAAQREVLRKLYTELPPLPEETRPLPGPGGKQYTLADFQRIAAENSPALRQAAADVHAARGTMIQASTYTNPNVVVGVQPSNDNSTAGAFGFQFDQKIIMGGKLRLNTAAARKDLDNAELALKRARSDLATQVRNAYYALLVAKETMRVTRALAGLTDEVYRVQLTLTERGGFGAAYEPAPLRAQAYSARLAYKQSTATYMYAWKQLVATIGLRQLPLSEVAGRIDAAIPYYEYDKVLGQVLRAHTDVLAARNSIDKYRYTLKVNQVSPYYPDIDLQGGFYHDFALSPFGMYHLFSVSAPIPVWDQNRGNILAAESTLARAIEEPHRVEVMLTNNLAMTYTNYKTNLDAVEYYRRYILPDQVRAYRGILERRQVDPGAQFNDLVTAQQTLSTGVTTYLGLLSSLWQGVVSVADLLQTDDLFQTAEVRGLPPLPDLEHLPPLPCCHPFGETGATPPAAGAVPPDSPTRPLPAGPQLPLPQPVPPAAGPTMLPLFRRPEPASAVIPLPDPPPLVDPAVVPSVAPVVPWQRPGIRPASG
ncbi:MAG: outer membrane protein [Gemmataceae bacterium]|nr:outer membrane protein [Gemmataceae bacterium]